MARDPLLVMLRVVLGLVLAGMLAVSFASYAAGADAADQLSARSTAMLERVTGADLPTRPIIAVPDVDLDECQPFVAVAMPRGCAAAASADAIYVRAAQRRAIARLARMHPRLDWPDVDTATTVIHEGLHDGRRFGPVEEGIVAALTWDLTPAWFWQTLRVRGVRAGPLGYADRGWPQMIREASHRATGKPWPSWAARRWRIWLYTLSDAARVAAIEGAFGVR